MNFAFQIIAALLLQCARGAVAVDPLRLDGLVTAVFSPFDADGALNVSVVPAQREYLRATGVDWVFVGGTTGESLSLTLAERKALTETWCVDVASSFFTIFFFVRRRRD